MAKLPYMPFYPGDWMKDANLRRCSPSARGIWIDMLCLMFDSPERGVLTFNGRPWTDEEIVNSIPGCATDLLGTLLDNGVAKRREDGAVYSSRLVNDEKIRSVRAVSGSKGGSKTQAKRLAKTKQIPEDEDEDEDVNEDNTESESEKKKNVVVFPECLDTVEFRQSWADWHAYRIEAKLKAYVPRGAKAQLTKLAKLGHDDAAAAIAHSIAQGYQGIYPDRSTNDGNNRSGSQGNRQDAQGQGASGEHDADRRSRSSHDAAEVRRKREREREIPEKAPTLTCIRYKDGKRIVSKI